MVLDIPKLFATGVNGAHLHLRPLRPADDRHLAGGVRVGFRVWGLGVRVWAKGHLISG